MKEHYGDTEYTIRYMSQLNRVNVKSKVYLYSCNGATVDKWGNTAAGNFAQKVRGVPVRAVMNGKLNINYFTGLVENVGGFWIEIAYIKYGIKQKYLFLFYFKMSFKYYERKG